VTLQLFGHPFSSYTWKALIALEENATPFDFRMLDEEHPANNAELRRHWPLGKFPLLLDGGRGVIEATAIIEYLGVFHPGPARLIPDDAAVAVEVRMIDRLMDNYVMTPMTMMVFDALRPEAHRDDYGVTQARDTLDTAYAYLDRRMAGREWATADFSLADCAAAPALFYADWTHPMDGRFPALAAYRARLLARPSVAKAVDGGRPYRAFFPLGAPDRD
jgi:glutathione S-transferase